MTVVRSQSEYDKSYQKINACINLNGMNAYSCLLHLMSTHFNPAIDHFGGFVIVKDKLPATNDFHNNFDKVTQYITNKWTDA